MTTPPRTRQESSIPEVSQRVQVFLSSEELAEVSGISVTRLERLVRIGVVEPSAPGAGEFTAATAARLKRMLRLHDDLGVNFTGAAILVEFVERLEQLHAELGRLHRGELERDR